MSFNIKDFLVVWFFVFGTITIAAKLSHERTNDFKQQYKPQVTPNMFTPCEELSYIKKYCFVSKGRESNI